MPKKATQKPEEKTDSRKSKKTSPVAEGDAEVAVQAEVAPKTRGAKKGAKREAPATTAPATSTTTESAVTADTSKTRHVPTRESVETEFNELISSLEEEINKLRSTSAKSKGVKFLRTINKRVKALRNHALRVSKQRQTTRRNNTNSGFLKPVQISKDLAKFTGWEQTQLRSRVDVTKFICDYIRDHNLQDPTDKRNIRVDQDQNLKKLLKFDGKDGKPLTYYSLQTYLKSHFSPAPEATATATATADAKKVKA